MALSGADGALASFTGPAAGGTLTFALTVTDGDGLVGSAQVAVQVEPAPVASASASASTASAGATVTLDGSQSVGAASYHWEQTAGTPVALGDPSAVSPTFVAPSVKAGSEVLTFRLTITSPCGATSAASVSITVVRPR